MNEPRQTFRSLISSNKRKSVVLVVIFCLVVAILSLVLTLGAMAYVAPALFEGEGPLAPALDKNKQISHQPGQPQIVYPQKAPGSEGPEINWPTAIMIGVIGGALALTFSFLGYFSGDDAIMYAHRARRVFHDGDPELFNVVEEMAIAAGIPPPRIYFIHDEAPNAFATGRDPHHASVAITSGLRGKLTRDELQGVIAHEMSHIQNYDVRLMLLMAVLVGAVVMLCDVFWQIVRWGWAVPSKEPEAAKEGANLAVLFVVLAVLLSLIAPILAQIIQLAISREREYLADATAVQLTRNPLGLANALRVIANDPAILKTGNRATAHMFLVNPIQKFQAKAHSMFASHPPIEERIRRLEALAHVERTPV
jgi:heat shock protein HtpX